MLIRLSGRNEPYGHVLFSRTLVDEDLVKADTSVDPIKYEVVHLLGEVFRTDCGITTELNEEIEDWQGELCPKCRTQYV